MKNSVYGLFVAMALAATGAQAASNIFRATTETGYRYNPGNANRIAFDDVFVGGVTPGPGPGYKAKLSSVTYGIRRGPTGGALTPVGVDLYAATMSPGGALGSVYLLGSASLDGRASAGFVTELVTITPNRSFDLELTTNPGFGGLWLGVQFTGANAANSINGWRIVNAPTIGTSADTFAELTLPSTVNYYYFSTNANPLADFYLNVSGDVYQVPEPGQWAMMGLTLVGATGYAVRRYRLARTK